MMSPYYASLNSSAYVDTTNSVIQPSEGFSFGVSADSSGIGEASYNFNLQLLSGSGP